MQKRGSAGWGERFSVECGDMSRLGRRPLPIPPGVTVEADETSVRVEGPKGTLTTRLPRGIVAAVEDGAVVVRPAPGRERARGVAAVWGTAWAHIGNALRGVTEGFTKKLELQGVGYRAELTGRTLKLLLGFSHPVEVEAPEGITFSVEKNIITVAGSSKQAVGEAAAAIRRIRPPEPYKGKGVRYEGEVVRRKPGKLAGAAGASGAGGASAS